MPIQADRWEDCLPALKKLNDAVSSLPAPPVPDDEYSRKLNDLNRTTEGISEQIQGRVQMEREAEELRP